MPGKRDATDERLLQVLEGGTTARAACSPAAICMAEGKLSLEDCPLLTWSLGWTGDLPPRLPAGSSLARPGDHLVAFMSDWVPEPVCQTTRGK